MTISKEEIKIALINSGYLLEDRINRLLSEKKWQTVPNDRYIDIESQVEREIDIIALKNLNDYNDNIDGINSTLIIECMNNFEPIAFFNNLKELPSSIAGLSYHNFNKKFSDILFWAQQKLDNKSNYLFSSQYCSFQKKKQNNAENQGWFSTHPEDKHNSIDSLFKYIKYKKEEFKNEINTQAHIYGFFYRPLIILQGELLLVTQKEDLVIENIEHVKYQIPKTNNDGKFFLVDVITEKYLSKYLEIVSNEDNEIYKMCKENRDIII